MAHNLLLCRTALFYAHSLGKYSALKAIERRSSQISEASVLDALADCMADVDYTIQESYTRATEKIYRKATSLRRCLRHAH